MASLRRVLWNAFKWSALAALLIAAPACGDDEASPDTSGQGGGAGAGGGTGGTGGSTAVEWPAVQSEIPSDPAIEQAIIEILAQMTVAQKVGQMTQGEIRWVAPSDVRTYHLGSVLNGGGTWPSNNKDATVADWVALANEYYNASTDTSGEPGEHLGIPVLWATDAVHGHNNVKGATLFPHNIGLGAARDLDLLERIGVFTARQVAVTGLDWSFAPMVPVVRDDRWGRTYEGYSEDPEVVNAYAGRIIRGLQGEPADATDLFNERHVIATAKSFLGDGGTQGGDDAGDTRCSEEELRDIHAQGYLSALAAGAQTVMASFSSWNGQKMHSNKHLLTEVLKGALGFDGFVIGDWNGHAEVPGCDETQCADAVNAGVDMFMVPEQWQAFIANTMAQVESGEIPMERIDDAVTRILRVKMRLGLLGPNTTKGAPSTRELAGQTAELSSDDVRGCARDAVRKSLVLLKNKGSVLPLAPSMNVIVAGKSADSIPNQTGGWTLTWQGDGNTNADFPNARSVYGGISDALTTGGGNATLSVNGAGASNEFDAAIVVIGETPYAEFVGDIEPEQTLELAALHPEDLAVIETLRTLAPEVPIVTVLLSGRPLYVNKELNRSDAFVAAWLPGTEGGGIADVLFGIGSDFHGKLSFSWPAEDCQTPINRGDGKAALFPYGFGLTYADEDTLGDDLPEISTVGGCSPGD